MPAAHHLSIRDRTDADQSWTEELLRVRWGGAIVVAHGVRFDAAALPALIVGDRRGLATYRVDGEAELVTLDAARPKQGVGTALLAALVRRLGAATVRTLWVTTTNDNLDALRFYQRRGFRLARLRCRAVDDARRLKPSIPLAGAYGIALRDELDLSLDLPDPA
jgi:ribosomal protein S18 acetylase RimI-like enzyme